MFEPGGISYVYLCYGIHHLFNIVTNKKNIPQGEDERDDSHENCPRKIP